MILLDMGDLVEFLDTLITCAAHIVTCERNLRDSVAQSANVLKVLEVLGLTGVLLRVCSPRTSGGCDWYLL